MMLPIFCGNNYGYLYEAETSHILLHDNEFKSHAYLQGDDAKIFQSEIERIDRLPDPENKTGLLIENLISFYL